MKNRIEVEGKEKFCESSLEALKSMKNRKAMKNLNREVRKYCAKFTDDDDEQFIASLKRFERKQFPEGNYNAGQKIFSDND